MFKVDKEKLIMTTIKLYRERGASYSEIATQLNKDKIYTLNGKEWSSVWAFRFFNGRQKEKALKD